MPGGVPGFEGRQLGTDSRRELVDAFVNAWERADVAALLDLLADDAQITMPLLPAWFRGREDVARFLAERVFATPWRLVRRYSHPIGSRAWPPLDAAVGPHVHVAVTSVRSQPQFDAFRPVAGGDSVIRQSCVQFEIAHERPGDPSFAVAHVLTEWHGVRTGLVGGAQRPGHAQEHHRLPVAVVSPDTGGDLERSVAPLAVLSGVAVGCVPDLGERRRRRTAVRYRLIATRS